MKTKITLLASALFALVAGSASAGPDFVGKSHGPKDLAASDARTAILPTDDVAFDHNSYALRDTTMTQIATVARWMKENPNRKIVLEGHADSSGDALYNDDLASKRAELVRSHLVGHGVKADRILVVVFGESQAKRDVSPVDRRVVMWATHEPLDVIARRVLIDNRANHAMWTRNGVLFTETRGTPRVTDGAVASR